MRWRRRWHRRRARRWQAIGGDLLLLHVLGLQVDHPHRVRAYLAELPREVLATLLRRVVVRL